MQQKISLRLLPVEASDEILIKKLLAKSSGKNENEINGFHILKRSIDARANTVWVNITVNAFINEPFIKRKINQFNFQDVFKAAKKVIIIGAGPAGLFAALKLIEKGIKPIILERGKDVRARRRDLAILNKEGIIDADSNYCFGEGGAGTYSDGKLYTRSTKRGDVERILQLFVYFGADENILYEAHPHIGTNKLPQIITAMRNKILACGGEFLFNKKVVDISIKTTIAGTNVTTIESIKTADEEFIADAYILATGHSARDIFYLLKNKNILIYSKSFAMGVRIEHPQNLINNIQYHNTSAKNFLPPASYALVNQVNGKGVFSFCMCPGGIIAPAATSNNELVVNGWSPSKRNNPFANSGIVVQAEVSDAWPEIEKSKLKIEHDDPLLLMEFQKLIEQKAFAAGGGNFVAPAQRLGDFLENKVSGTLPKCSYLPGLYSAELDNVLPAFISERLKTALKYFGKKMKGFITNEAVIVAVESRTSSPVRIPRENLTLHHPQIKNLYPCGEGGGYAGGIVSAAMDGEKIANALATVLK